MLQRIKQEYVDVVTDLMKTYVEEHYAELIGERFNDPANRRYEDIIDIELGWDMDLAIWPQTKPDGTLERNEYGEILVKKVDVSGDTQYFLAFCLQEGELYPGFRCIAEKYPDKYGCGSPVIFVGHEQDDTDLKEWREYIKNKYHIFPPKLDDDFSKIVSHCFLITGGIEFVTGEAENVNALDFDQPTDSLGLSEPIIKSLHWAGIDTIQELVDRYNERTLSTVRQLGSKALKEIETALLKFGVPKRMQI
jgi:hypothetical protein